MLDMPTTSVVAWSSGKRATCTCHSGPHKKVLLIITSQGRSAICRAFIHMVEKIPRQGRLEGCHRVSAATHLICGLESV